jgi:hypothetical protein
MADDVNTKPDGPVRFPVVVEVNRVKVEVVLLLKPSTTATVEGTKTTTWTAENDQNQTGRTDHV